MNVPQSDLMRYILESVAFHIAIQARTRPVVLQPHSVRCHITYIFPVSRHKNVQPPVVVVVPEPCGKAVGRFGDVQFSGDIAESRIPVVSVKPVFTSEV